MKFKKLIITSVAAVSLLGAVNVASVQAATTNKSVINSQTKKQKKVNTQAQNTPLTKDGYVVRLIDPKLKVMVGKANYERAAKSIVPFKSQTINSNKFKNMKFRIEKAHYFNGDAGGGAPLFLIASKDKKYSAWATQSELQYYYLNSKSMAGVTKPLKRIANRYVNGKNYWKMCGNINAPKNKEDFQLAEKAAQKLKGSQKKFIVQSLKQLKKDGTMDKEGHNLLLFSIA